MRAFMAAAALAIVATAGVRAEVIERVLGAVGGQLIMLSDVEASRQLGLVTPDPGSDPIRSVLSKLIDRALVMAEVDRYAPPEPSAEAVEREFQAVRGRFPSDQAFQAVLARCGIDEGHLRETIRENLRIVAYETQRFTVAPPNDEQLNAYYRAHPEAFTRSGRVQPFESVRADVARDLVAENRKALIDDWVSGLRRRADVVDLYANK